jgi:hypothetical protein
MPDGQMTAPKGTYERQAGDLYPTPAWVTQVLCDAVRFRGRVWEPAAGRGDMANVLRDAGYDVRCTDIEGDRLGCDGCFEQDFLKTHHGTLSLGRFGEAFSIITNPPYSHAQEFIRQALALTEPVGGMVAMLLRNEFDCGIKRRDLWVRPSFREKIVLTKRPFWFNDAPMQNHPRHNFSWLLWDHEHIGPATIRWLPARKDTAP